MLKSTLLYSRLSLLLCVGLLQGCAGTAKYTSLPSATSAPPSTVTPADYNYLIGPGDGLNVFVWRNPEVSSTVTVRPDGKITTPLVEDIQASGKTPTQLARDIEKVLATYVKEPVVTVMMTQYVGPYSEQVRVIGEAARPQALSYRSHMTLLDVMIAVGGLTQYADGNNATLVRLVDGKQEQFSIRLEDLVRDGDISANVDILPGDVLIVPEAWF